MNTNKKLAYLEEKQQEYSFSGAFYGQKGNDILMGSYGYANRSDKLANQVDTRFSIASGCKIFTAVAICKLVEERKLSFDSKLKDCTNIRFPHFSEDITVQHLLTHTSGVPDYFDEETMEDYEELWVSRPVYGVREPKDFLPLFQDDTMQAEPGGSFQYNNSGYILLGLIVEHMAGCSFTDYVEEHVFRKAGMLDSGYFEVDSLPERVALGYVEQKDGKWKTNIFSLPAKGGPDGGAYTTVEDMAKFWKALTGNRLLSKNMTEMLVKPRVEVDAEEQIFYGYCGYMEVDDHHDAVQYIQMGYDPGVNFRAVHLPQDGTTIVVCSNETEGAYEMMKEIKKVLAV
ncbi:serine hydrolase [Sporosarcina sp. Sa2YVA2]|uniref:Serine hydrolase n=1 Tax=Sporosarcina quadrami TaxID=2762234 RepID=A0ABR8UEG1_9BACL|nr:serine hydrolase [Sporosarcina quadrami]MBD7986220.1 serine hydrolase [Sporosarcina quadrami]